MRRYCPLLLIMLSCSKQDNISPPRPSFTAQQIVFISRRIPNSADWQLYVMNADGTNQRELAAELVACAPPAVSADGSSVAYAAYDGLMYKIFAMGLDGSNKKLLGTNDDYCGALTWSPDNATVAYVRSFGNGARFDIVIVDVSSGNETIVSHKQYNHSPAFLDNNTLLFSSADQGGLSGVYAVDLLTLETRLLTPANKSFGYPKVSPDRRKAAIVLADPGGTQIFTMNIDGSMLKQLTNSVSPQTYPGWPRDGNHEPSWSPDSKQIAYVSYAANGSPDVYVMDANGDRKRALTNGELRDESPCWSPDGRTILFSSNRDMNFSTEIYTMDPNGRNQKALTKFLSDDAFPVYAQ
jgi:Tol biopolymer transport system component